MNSWCYVNIPITYFLALFNDNGSSIKAKINIMPKESTTSKIVRIVLYIVFIFVGLVGLLYCFFVVLKSKKNYSFYLEIKEASAKPLVLSKSEIQKYFPLIEDKNLLPKNTLCPVCEESILLETTRIIPRTETFIHDDCVGLWFESHNV